MKTIKTLSLIFASILVLGLTSCSSDDDNTTPQPVNEEEVITTLILTLTSNGNPTVTMTSDDPDGDGPNDLVITVSGDLVAGASYQGTVQVLNRTEDPAENITEEVEEEDDEHQFFFFVNGVDLATTYENFDGDGNPLGTEITVDAGAASSGTYLVVLRHEPKKPNDGSLADAGGETDLEVTFPVTVQ